MAPGRSGAWILGEDVRDMVSNGLRTEEQLAGDRRVVEAFCKKLQDVELAVGELREWPSGRPAANLRQLGDPLGEKVVEHDVAGSDGAYGVLDPLGTGAFHEVSTGSVAQRRERVVEIFRHRQHHDPHFGVVLGQPDTKRGTFTR